MPIFQKSVVNKYLNSLNESDISEAFQKFKKFYGDSERIENIKQLKEENYQEGFLREIFVDVLGYTINPDKNYNLTTEYKNETDSKKADGAILKEGKAVGVIELKSVKTTNMESITDQAFNYKNHQSGCKYVITSNYEKLRFYIDNATEFEEFYLFDLTEKDFKIFFLLLNKENLLKDIPAKLKEESKLHEENISDQLYKDYSEFKHKIYNNLVKNNPGYDKLLLFKKSQKLLDRILFILFAEDSGLVPPNAITRIIDDWKKLAELDEAKPLYHRFIKFFHHLNVGHSYTSFELPAYNGGLFREDEVLDNVTIDDEILLNDSLKLSTYDFSTEVDVNILGHIFEHSLTEIEEIAAEIEGAKVDRSKTKRKKDGIFYTPKYITKYIVDNTIGALCDEKKKELQLYDIDSEIIENSKTTKGALTKKAKELFNNLEKYREYILSLKILDPACGSGAFLNQALDFLIEEHKWIDEHRSSLLKESFVIAEYGKEILENNLYGVDINDEAVEIAKLSLWLRTAKKGRKLSNLNNNIKCGNSLIDDPEVAGEKAFNWNKEFEEIMNNGGFDVVIGNPPYVPAERISTSEKVYFEKNYVSAFGRINIYPLFYELAIRLCKVSRYVGFITPYTVLKNKYYVEVRRLLLQETRLKTIVDFSNIKVFKDAAVDSIIIIFEKGQNDNNEINYVSEIKDLSSNQFKENTFLQSSIFDSSDLSFYNNTDELIEKVYDNSEKIESIINFKQGIITGNNKKFLTKVSDSLTKKVITGADFNRYLIDYQNNLIKYDVKSLHRPRTTDIFEVAEKILLRQTGSYPICTIDNEQYYTLDTVHNGHLINNKYNIKYILCLLNSSLLKYLYQKLINETSKIFAQVKIIYVNPLPIKIIDIPEQNKFIKKVELIISLNKDFITKSYQYINRLNSNFTFDKLTNKLKEFYLYDFKTFLAELKKKKIELTLKQQDEWEEYFNEHKKEILDIKEQIDKTDHEIDVMVYKLYNLTYEEVKIVDPEFWMSEGEYESFKVV